MSTVAVPLAYLPIAEVTNPVVVVRVSGLSSNISIEVTPSGGVDSIKLPESVAKYVTRFKRELEYLVNMSFRLVCEGRVDYDVLGYVSVTNRVLRELLSHLSIDDLGIAYSIDRRLGLPDHVLGLRPADLVSQHYAWRRGESLVELGESVVFKVKAVRKVCRLSQPFLDVDKEALIHLTGKSAIALARAIADGDVGRVERILEFINGLWYSTYGLKIPCGGAPSIYVPGLEEVYCVEFDVSPKTSSF